MENKKRLSKYCKHIKKKSHQHFINDDKRQETEVQKCQNYALRLCHHSVVCPSESSEHFFSTGKCSCQYISWPQLLRNLRKLPKNVYICSCLCKENIDQYSFVSARKPLRWSSYNLFQCSAVTVTTPLDQDGRLNVHCVSCC